VTTSDSAPLPSHRKAAGRYCLRRFRPGRAPLRPGTPGVGPVGRRAARCRHARRVRGAVCSRAGEADRPAGDRPRGRAHVPSRAGRAASESRTRPEDGCAVQPPRCGTPRHTGKATGMRRRSPHRATAAGLPDWRDRAACRHADPELFFRISTDGPSMDQARHAKRVCAVRAACLAWALAHPGTSGIWGGTTEDERRVLASPPKRQSRWARPRAFPRHGRQESP